MATYRIQQRASIWYEVETTADTLQEALNWATDEFLAGGGFVDPESLDFQEEYYVENKSTGEEGLVTYDDDFNPVIDS